MRSQGSLIQRDHAWLASGTACERFNFFRSYRGFANLAHDRQSDRGRLGIVSTQPQSAIASDSRRPVAQPSRRQMVSRPEEEDRRAASGSRNSLRPHAGLAAMASNAHQESLRYRREARSAARCRAIAIAHDRDSSGEHEPDDRYALIARSIACPQAFGGPLGLDKLSSSIKRPDPTRSPIDVVGSQIDQLRI